MEIIRRIAEIIFILSASLVVYNSSPGLVESLMNESFVDMTSFSMCEVNYFNDAICDSRTKIFSSLPIGMLLVPSDMVLRISEASPDLQLCFDGGHFLLQED